MDLLRASAELCGQRSAVHDPNPYIVENGRAGAVLRLGRVTWVAQSCHYLSSSAPGGGRERTMAFMLDVPIVLSPCRTGFRAAGRRNY